MGNGRTAGLADGRADRRAVVRGQGRTSGRTDREAARGSSNSLEPCTSQSAAASRCAEYGLSLCSSSALKTEIGQMCAPMYTADDANNVFWVSDGSNSALGGDCSATCGSTADELKSTTACQADAACCSTVQGWSFMNNGGTEVGWASSATSLVAASWAGTGGVSEWVCSAVDAFVVFISACCSQLAR